MNLAQKICEANTSTLAEFLCEPCGDGGSGETIYVVAEGFDVDFIEDTFDANLDILTASADIKIDTYDVVDLEVDDLSADFEDIKLDGDLI